MSPMDCKHPLAELKFDLIKHLRVRCRACDTLFDADELLAYDRKGYSQRINLILRAGAGEAVPEVSLAQFLPAGVNPEAQYPLEAV